jgi:hypothetical protein
MPINHTLILSASGLSGCAITNEILNDYPSPDSFVKVTALANRPLSRDGSLRLDSDKLQLVGGPDLLKPKAQYALEDEVKAKIMDVDTLPHAFFLASSFQCSWVTISSLRRPSTRPFCLQIPTPLSESLPRIREPHAYQIFSLQTDLLTNLSRDKPWTWHSNSQRDRWLRPQQQFLLSCTAAGTIPLLVPKH